MKPAFSYLRQRGHVSSGCIDDAFLQGDSYHLCRENVHATLKLFRDLGFWPHEFEIISLVFSVAFTVRATIGTFGNMALSIPRNKLGTGLKIIISL